MQESYSSLHASGYTIFSATDDSEVEVAAYKTKSVKKLDDKTHVFHCTIQNSWGGRENLNMIVLVNNGKLTLIDPVRLTRKGEEKLEQLGKVRHIVRLGASMYGAAADEYYLEKYSSVRRWAPGKFSSCPNPPIDYFLDDGKDAKQLCPDCKVFRFKKTHEPEAALLLLRSQGGNILVTSKCLQTQIDNKYINAPVKAKMQLDGLLISTVVISPKWLQDMTTPAEAWWKALTTGTDDRDQIFRECRQLVGLNFNRLVSSSGNKTLTKAKKVSLLALEQAFQRWQK